MSIIFLSIYCAVVFHNIVPHVHSDSTTNDAHHTTHHSHQHHHHHNEENISWTDYILGLLGDLQHTDLGDDHFENFTAQGSSFDLAQLYFTEINLISIYQTPSNSIGQEKTPKHIGHPKILYEQHHVCSSPLRGPPYIS